MKLQMRKHEKVKLKIVQIDMATKSVSAYTRPPPFQI